MAKPSGMMIKMRAAMEAEISYNRKFTVQWCEDAALIAANEVFKRRGEKLAEFRDAFREIVMEIAHTTIDDARGDKSLEYTKDRLDGRLKGILDEKDFEDWSMRYGGIRHE